MFEGLEKICEVYRVESYAYDETPRPIAPKAENFVVVKPKNTIEISKILKFANDRKIPVFIRGGGTGLSGGAIPTKRGILISTEKMKGIVIDKKNRVAICDCGVTLEELSRTAEKNGLCFPPRPGAENATIGGMIATNAGGMRALKFGVMRNYVVGVEIVLPNGKIMELGGKVLKNSSGYSLLHLIIGSEGTLAVITKAIIKLLPPLKDTSALAIPFRKVEDSLDFAIETSLHTTPLALEFMDEKAVRIGEKISGKKWVSKDGSAHILAIFEHKEEAEKIAEIAFSFNPIDVFILSQKEQTDLLELRGKIYVGLKDKIIEILDVCLPIGEISNYLQRSYELATKYGIEMITYGHLGDGNIHQHPLLFENWNKIYPSFRKKLLKLAVDLGGVISGEHGIGVLKREEFREFYPDHFRLMFEIKKVFDPNNILNPDRIF
ncbi:MAG: FAD-binding oxidoreductase [Archaeoglobaceae archaeon]|nr:FAD-binding oxidoreductase [Archaeoglobaceae archaeon]